MSQLQSRGGSFISTPLHIQALTSMDHPVNSGQTLSTMVTNIKFFSYMFSFLLSFTLARMFSHLPYWRYIVALSISGMIGTLLNTVETSILIPEDNIAAFRASVVFSETCWFVNEISVILISYLKCMPLLVVTPRIQKHVVTFMYIFCPLLLALRLFILGQRFKQGQSWNRPIEVAQRPYFCALAIADLCFGCIFAYFIMRYYRNPNRTEMSLDMVSNSTDEMLTILRASSNARLLIVNLIMLLLTVAFFTIDTPVGKFLLDLTTCFKFNFGTFFLIDLIFMRQQRML